MLLFLTLVFLGLSESLPTDVNRKKIVLTKPFLPKTGAAFLIDSSANFKVGKIGVVPKIPAY